jgi:hypothetical protein
LYTEQEVDLATAVKEWKEAGEVYVSFETLETKMTGQDRAEVRVAYKCTVSGPGKPYSADAPEPGEWWRVARVNGVWRVCWMPRR